MNEGSLLTRRRDGDAVVIFRWERPRDLRSKPLHTTSIEIYKYRHICEVKMVTKNKYL